MGLAYRSILFSGSWLIRHRSYDISNYRQIDKRYGSLEDWDRLLAALHQRGMKLVMDLVVNHTSDQVMLGRLAYL